MNARTGKEADSARRPLVAGEARILLVEDDSFLRRLGQHILNQAGYDVAMAANGAEGWTTLMASACDLLITDNQMPGLTGLELIRRIRLTNRTLPIILTSGSAGSPTTTPAWFIPGMILPKPFTPEQLLGAVSDLLRPDRQSIPAGTLVDSVRPERDPHQRWGINE